MVRRRECKSVSIYVRYRRLQSCRAQTLVHIAVGEVYSHSLLKCAKQADKQEQRCKRSPVQVLDVTSFLSEHPGGELAILTFAGCLQRMNRNCVGIRFTGTRCKSVIQALDKLQPSWSGRATGQGN